MIRYKLCQFNTCTTAKTLKHGRRKETSLKIYKVMAITTLAFCSKTWTLNMRDWYRIQDVKMKFLSLIKNALDMKKIRNEVIREELTDNITEKKNTNILEVP